MPGQHEPYEEPGTGRLSFEIAGVPDEKEKGGNKESAGKK